MSKSDSSNNSGGIGFCGMLFLVFLVLKLTGVINWSWWWVTAPLWGSFVLILGILGIVILGGLFVAGIAAWLEGRKPKGPKKVKIG